MPDWRVEFLNAKKYENLFEDTYQFDPPLGWKSIIRCLLEYIVWHNKVHKTDIQVWSCSKSHGGLRFAIDPNGSDKNSIGEIYGAIQFAEMMATTQCEKCGDNGELRKFQIDGSLELTTLCDEHYEEIEDAVYESKQKN